MKGGAGWTALSPQRPMYLVRRELTVRTYVTRFDLHLAFGSQTVSKDKRADLLRLAPLQS